MTFVVPLDFVQHVADLSIEGAEGAAAYLTDTLGLSDPFAMFAAKGEVFAVSQVGTLHLLQLESPQLSWQKI